jgi:hypothetical protein
VLDIGAHRLHLTAFGAGMRRPFEEAREYVRGLGLRNLSKWLRWAKGEARPGGIEDCRLMILD